MQLVQDDFVVRETDHDELVCMTLVEWYNRRPSLRGIQVMVMDGIAILQGRIASHRDRSLAIDLAWDAGADEVEDDLVLTWPIAA